MMVDKHKLLDNLVIPLAFLAGLIMEYLVFQLELTLMILGFQANTGFYVMLGLFLITPFLVTGGIIYYFKRDAMKAVIVSASVIPVYLYAITEFFR